MLIPLNRVTTIGLLLTASLALPVTAGAQTRPFPTPYPTAAPRSVAPPPARPAATPTPATAPQTRAVPAATPAPTASPSNFGLYIGGGAGFSRLDGEEFPDSTQQFDELKDERLSYRGTAGIRLGSVVSLEASYIYFGEYESTAFTTEVTAYTGALLLELPISQNFGVYGKGGMMFFDADLTSNANGQRFEDSDENPFYGLGVRLSLSRSLALRFEYERFEVFEGDIDTAGVNVLFTF